MLGTQIEAGRTGAKRQSWKRGNPRDVLARIARDNPEADENEVSDLVWQIVRHNTEQMGTVFEYWFANNYRSLTAASKAPPPASEDTAATPAGKAGQKTSIAAEAAQIVAQIDAKTEAKIESRVKIALLTMVMPTGKSLRNSTREELVEFGGWTQRVAEWLRPQQTVDEAGLSEAQLSELYDA